MIDQFYSDPLSLQHLRFGPLGTHIDTFAELLSAQGYARSTTKEKIRVVAGLSRWLHRRRLGVEAPPYCGCLTPSCFRIRSQRVFLISG